MMIDKQKIFLRGEICNVSMQTYGQIAEPASLNRMAKEALNYLEKNPNPELDYECRFAQYPSQIPYHISFFPANEYGYDTISLADTDVRMQMVWEPMRHMAGIFEPSNVEMGVYRRNDGYIKEDGGTYTNPAAFTGVEVDGTWLTIWGTAHQIIYFCDIYERTGEKEYLARAKKGLDCVLKLAVSKAGMMDFPYSTPYRDGEWLTLGWANEHKDNYVYIIEPLIRYYEVSGDEAYKKKAVLFAEAFVNCMRNTRKNLEINPEDGSFDRHTHFHTRCALAGIAHLAYITKESRYLRWARRVYDFVLSNAPGFGWYPEEMPSEGVSETCVNGDMMMTAYYLGLCGELDVYDEMERNWRNYLRCTQFFVTPDIENFIRFVNKDKTEVEIQNALQELKKLEGGFVAQVTWNDLTQRQYQMEEGKGDKMLYMMGCCPPSGMLALYYIWKGAVLKRKEGIFINMTVTTDTEYAELTADYNSENKLTVKAKESGNYFLRVPEWTTYEDAEVYINGTYVTPDWDGPQCRYLVVRDVKKEDVISLRYKLVRLSQKISETTLEGKRYYCFEWLGNSVLSVSPNAKYIDLFGVQRGLKEGCENV